MTTNKAAEALLDILVDIQEARADVAERWLRTGLENVITEATAQQAAEMAELRAALAALTDATDLLLSASETPLHDGHRMAPDWTTAYDAYLAARAALAAAPAVAPAPNSAPNPPAPGDEPDPTTLMEPAP